jgi:23S rRNA pseudouridine2605 synthase
VGRLDRDTEGLLILTNDGEFANQVAHPRYEVSKTYEVRTTAEPDARQLGRLRKGVRLDGRRTAPARVRVLRTGKEISLTEITICEGRNRQIRRMFAAVGLPVRDLRRTAIGALRDRSLKRGSYRRLNKKERKLILAGGDRHADR